MNNNSALWFSFPCLTERHERCLSDACDCACHMLDDDDE